MLLVSFIFTGAIGIFALVGGSNGNLSYYAGCDSTYTGVLDAWNGLDFYFQEVDQAFCSSNCPCDITNATMFTSASQSVQDSYDQWYTTDNVLYTTFVNNPEATNFTGCVANNVQNVTFASLQADLIANNSPTNATYFKQSLFAQYFADIETKFSCTGWCAYTDYTRGLDTFTINKYLFSDINK